MEDSIKKIIAKILRKSAGDIQGDDDLAEKYGMDSMQRVEIVIELEKVFDITIPDEDTFGLRSLNQIIQYLSVRKKA